MKKFKPVNCSTLEWS